MRRPRDRLEFREGGDTIERFEILGSGSLRPDAERILFCDGTGGSHFRAETDLELSRWQPNRTPAEYRDGTSTAICFRFLDRPHWTVDRGRQQPCRH